MTTKRCRLCKKRKPLKPGFYKNKRNGKHLRRCRDCWDSRPNENPEQAPKGRALIIHQGVAWT